MFEDLYQRISMLLVSAMARGRGQNHWSYQGALGRNRKRARRAVVYESSIGSDRPYPAKASGRPRSSPEASILSAENLRRRAAS
jgi:hypothetical protein